MRRIRTMLSVAALAFAPVSIALADMPPLLTPTTTPTTPGAFYLSIGGLGAVHRSKGFEYGTRQRIYSNGDVDNGQALFSYGKSITVGGGTATIGYALDKGDPLGGIGRRARIEFAFTLFRGSQRDGGVTDGACDGVTSCEYSYTGSIGGPNANGLGVLVAPAPGVPISSGAGVNLTSEYRSEYWGGDGTVRYRTDLQLTRRLFLTPSFGVLGGAQVRKHELRYNYAGLGYPSAYAGEVTATLSSFSVGPEFGSVVTWQATRRIALHGGATFAILHRQASLRGQDCGTTLGAACPFPLLPPELVSSSVDTSASRIAYRVGIEVGATVKARPWLHVTITGFGSYDTAVPGIGRNPAATDGIGAFDAGAAPAKVVFSGEWSYGGALLLTIPFR